MRQARTIHTRSALSFMLNKGLSSMSIRATIAPRSTIQYAEDICLLIKSVNELNEVLLYV